MAKWDLEYHKLCDKILTEGIKTENRTGVDAYKIIHHTLNFDLEDEFPILTTKYVAFKSAVLEMLWIYQVMSNDLKWLHDRKITIWDEWEIDSDGYYGEKYFGKELANTIGTAYGYIVKKYDLTRKLINKLQSDVNDRRMIISLWQEEFLKTGVLEPCVWNSQWDVTDGKLNCMVSQRSCDVPLGLPFNVTQYAVLVHLMAQVNNLKPGNLTWVINNAHIYENQIMGIKEQMSRINQAYSAPTLWINDKVTDFFEFDSSANLNDIRLENYKHHVKIKMPVSK